MKTGSLSGMPPGFSIPLVDLDTEEDRQIVVDREPGQYLGHPTTALLGDSRTILIVYPKGHGRGEIVYKRSPDGGLTWSSRLPVPDNWSTSLEVPTIYRLRDRSGHWRLIMFSGLYPIRMAVSKDDGGSWSPLEPIGDFGGIVAMADLMELADGSHMAVFHDRGEYLTANGVDTGGMTVYKCLSQDGGLTWSTPIPVTTHPRAHLCEPGLLRSPDGRQIAMLLRENSRQYNSFVVFSDDEGVSWTEPVELPASLTGDRHQARYTPDGRVLVLFRDRAHESPTWGDFCGWVGTYQDILEQREGQYRIRLKDNHHGPDQRIEGADSTYPAMELLPDGTFVTTTYGHWVAGEQPYILSVRFTMEELDARVGGPGS
jgi:hypothetical protein